MSKEIVELVTENPINVHSASELVKNWSNAKTKLLWSFFEALKEALIKQGIKLDELNETVSEEKILIRYDKKFATKYPPFGLFCYVHEQNDVIIRWACMVDQNFHFGFKIWKNKVPANEASEYAFYKKMMTENDANFIQSPNWLSGYQFTNPQLNFYEFNSEAIFNLADKSVLEKTVKQIAERASQDILSFQLKLAELGKN